MIKKSLSLNSLEMLRMTKPHTDTKGTKSSMNVLSKIFRAPSAALRAPTPNEFELARAMTDYPRLGSDTQSPHDTQQSTQEDPQRETRATSQSSPQFCTIFSDETISTTDETHL